MLFFQFYQYLNAHLGQLGVSLLEALQDRMHINFGTAAEVTHSCQALHEVAFTLCPMILHCSQHLCQPQMACGQLASLFAEQVKDLLTIASLHCLPDITQRFQELMSPFAILTPQIFKQLSAAMDCIKQLPSQQTDALIAAIPCGTKRFAKPQTLLTQGGCGTLELLLDFTKSCLRKRAFVAPTNALEELLLPICHSPRNRPQHTADVCAANTLA
mmetsp:Transcript_25442/g.49841  ORF Transcript_25442/g.49841 Transcript_25442/m.49841 type:complete len:215 (-) Transcript_25442:935-1579(-)